MDEQKYNGWTNYETWAVSLWLDNDQGTYDYWREKAQEMREEAPTSRQVSKGIWSAAEAEKFNLADQLKEEITDSAPLDDANCYTDLLNAALSEVNWAEIAGNILESLPEPEPEEAEEEAKEESRLESEEPTVSPFGPVVFSYSRAQAIADGVLVDVSKTAEEAGIKYPTALSSAVWGKYVEVPRSVSWQDEAGRLWDIVFLLSLAIRQSSGRSEIQFTVHVHNDRRGPQPVELKAVCGPGDDAEPVITVMLPEED